MRLPVTNHPSGGQNYIYLDSYKQWLSQRSVTPNTLRAYHSRIKQFLYFLEYADLGDHSFNDLNDMNKAMSLYLDFVKHSKNGARSVNANINALNNFSSFLGLTKAQLKRERSYERPTSILTPDEQQRFLRCVDQQESVRDKALAMVLFYTGLRIGDCARLNVGDIGAGAICISPNNGAKVMLNESTAPVLRQWLEERLKLADATANSALWLTKQGERLSISGVAFVIKRIGWQARLVISSEMLRRTWLTKATDHLNKRGLASKFGGYISAATINRYSIALPAAAATSPFEH